MTSSNHFSPKTSHNDVYDQIELRQILHGNHKVLFHQASPYQDMLLVEFSSIYMYIDGQLQFHSLDENIYYESLVHPCFHLAPSHRKVLLIGGENGLALREILKYKDVDKVDLVDADPMLTDIAKNVPEIVKLNQQSLLDKRVFVSEEPIEEFLEDEKEKYNIIILDLLDPTIQELASYYTKEFFELLSTHLSPDGMIACHSQSPKYDPHVFWSIGATMQSAGLHTLSYHTLVPSFGDWGFHLASRVPLQWNQQKLSVKTHTLPDDLTDLSTFSDDILKFKPYAKINTLKNINLNKLYTGSILVSSTDSHPETEDHPIGDLEDHPIGDLEDQFELKHLLSGKHRILFEGSNENHEVIVIETKDVRMYLDGQLQYSSLDEKIYHEALVHPALAFLPSRDRILILGGGDGMAMREVLKYADVKRVDLVDLDPVVLSAAQQVPDIVSNNKASLFDSRSHIFAQDAQEFVKQPGEPYNAIIIDFPDPSDEIISRLYSKEFFEQIVQRLVPDGTLVCQSFSPEDAPLVYWSIGKTIESLGLRTISYHTYVPSFGDWGFHMAGNHFRENMIAAIPRDTTTLPHDIASLFKFPPKVEKARSQAAINTLERLTLHHFYMEEAKSN